MSIPLDGGDRPALSDRSIQLRKKKRRICYMIHNITWLAESFTLLFCLMLQLIALNQDPYFVNSFNDLWAAVVFWRIFAPYTHLFNEKRLKIMILEKGWLSAMKNALYCNISSGENQPSRRTFEPPSQNSRSNRVIKLTKSKTPGVNENKVGVDPSANIVPTVKLKSAKDIDQVLEQRNKHHSLALQEPGDLPNSVNAK